MQCCKESPKISVMNKVDSHGSIRVNGRVDDASCATKKPKKTVTSRTYGKVTRMYRLPTSIKDDVSGA